MNPGKTISIIISLKLGKLIGQHISSLSRGLISVSLIHIAQQALGLWHSNFKIKNLFIRGYQRTQILRKKLRQCNIKWSLALTPVAHAQVGLIASLKLCLNLCSFKWIRSWLWGKLYQTFRRDLVKMFCYMWKLSHHGKARCFSQPKFLF